jgi:hypothetical protein
MTTQAAFAVMGCYAACSQASTSRRNFPEYLFRKFLGTRAGALGSPCTIQPTKEYTVKKLAISIATVSLLLSAGAAFSQNPSPMVQKDTPTTQAAPTGQAKTAPAENKAAPSTQSTTRSGDHREGERHAQRSERRDRSGVSIRIGGDRDGYRRGYRHHRGYGYARYGAHCRTTVVKSYRHGHRVIKRIRRCW